MLAVGRADFGLARQGLMPPLRGRPVDFDAEFDADLADLRQLIKAAGDPKT